MGSWAVFPKSMIACLWSTEGRSSITSIEIRSNLCLATSFISRNRRKTANSKRHSSKRQAVYLASQIYCKSRNKSVNPQADPRGRMRTQRQSRSPNRPAARPNRLNKSPNRPNRQKNWRKQIKSRYRRKPVLLWRAALSSHQPQTRKLNDYQHSGKIF